MLIGYVQDFGHYYWYISDHVIELTVLENGKFDFYCIQFHLHVNSAKDMDEVTVLVAEMEHVDDSFPCQKNQSR